MAEGLDDGMAFRLGASLLRAIIDAVSMKF